MQCVLSRVTPVELVDFKFEPCSNLSLCGAGVGTRDRGRGSLPLVIMLRGKAKEVDYIVCTAWPQ